MSSATAPRKPAPRLPRPAARYWKGKVPKGLAPGGAASSSEDDDDEGRDENQLEEGDVLIEDVEEEEEEEEEGGLEVRQAITGAKGKGMGREGAGAGLSVKLGDVSVSREGRVTVAGRAEVGRTAVEIEEEEEEEDEEAEAGEEEEEEEEETSSEESSSEEEAPKVQFRPVFVPKRGRATIAEKEALSEGTEEAQRRKELEAAARKQQSHDMVAESIKRELAEQEKEAEVPDVDDTDGLDPTAEFDAWRLRELARIKRDKELALARELAAAEVARRRALPESQRLAEDLAHASASRAAKPKGQQKFLQKYWHKGAFHQDEEVLSRRDYTEATEGTVDVSVLPKVMQVRNFGKRGRTKYTHLVDQDTSAGAGGFGGTGPVGGGGTAGAGCFVCGGPHLKKDCPQNRELPPNRIGTGANSAPTGGRRWGGERERDGADGRGAWRDRDRERDERPRRDERERRGSYKDRDRSRDRDRRRERERDVPRRSRSRSPRRERRRSQSVSGGREKRRRLD
ncbi:hypothetical protein EIP86_007249 [Pleurotus ostreatoroseus]|nr:hypothetical protein EIP86_007249 [Pleurotus ostreatoroseus]